MAVQIIPLIKALGPIVTSIAASAIPAFTSGKSDAAKVDPLLAQQIKELQEASTTNARELHTLVEHVQKVISSADEAAAAAKRQIATYKMLLFLSLGSSAIALVIAIVALAR